MLSNVAIPREGIIGFFLLVLRCEPLTDIIDITKSEHLESSMTEF